MENQNRKIEFNWIKAHAGHHGNELVDQTAKEAAINSDINVCYTRPEKYSEARIERLQCNKVSKRMGHYNKRCNYENFSSQK